MPSDLSRYGFSSRFISPQGTGSIRVMIVGEAPGEEEDRADIPFCPWAPAGSILERAIRRLGMTRDQFVLVNTVPFRPPNNYLEGAPWEAEAISVCRPMLEEAIKTFRPRSILTLGGVATRTLTGLAGDKLGVSNLCGFVLPSIYDIPVVPCFHPSYLRRGAMSHFGILLRSIKLALLVAREERQPILPPVDNPPSGYIMYPTETVALEFERTIEVAKYVAYDIETPYSTTEDSAEEAEGEQSIKSVQFSCASGSGIYLPWRDPFIAPARRILASRIPKLGWNIWRFDDPILRENGATIGGTSHDLMWTWHHLQPDLPRGLQFAAAQNGWPWPWKHLDNSAPQFYGIVDVDVLQYLVSR
jgi:uracil-DNA glycosylase family 4